MNENEFVVMWALVLLIILTGVGLLVWTFLPKIINEAYVASNYVLEVIK